MLCTIKVKVITIKMRMISLIHINNMAAISFPSVKNIHAVYRDAQNHGKQVLRISCMKFHLLTFQFVVIPHGKRDLSSLPEVGEAAVQIS